MSLDRHLIAMQLLVFLVLVTASAGQMQASPRLVSKMGLDFDERISGGQDTTEGTYPWHATVEVYAPTQLLCGGALVSQGFVITAASCVHGATELSVVFGVRANEQLQMLNASCLHLHPKFVPGNLNNDIASIQLIQNVTLNGHVAAVDLISEELASGELEGNVVLTGFGMTAENSDLPRVLQNVLLPIIPSATCSALLQDAAISVTNAMMCTSGVGDKGGCWGDVGGPLVASLGGKSILVGLMGAHIECASGKPSVFTRVGSYLDFLDDPGNGKNYATICTITNHLLLLAPLVAIVRLYN